MNHERKEIPTDEEVRYAINTLMAACHGRAWNAGWWHDIETGEPVERNFGDICSLIHSEISEAYEAHRKKDRMDDHLPNRRGKIVELIDGLVRIFDYLGGEAEEEAADVFIDKTHYNDNRADHKPENRRKAGGKVL